MPFAVAMDKFYSVWVWLPNIFQLFQVPILRSLQSANKA